MTDTTDIQLFAVKRDSPSKGFNVAVFPGAPFGPEVVLSLRGRCDADEPFNAAPSAMVKTENEGDVDELSYMEITTGGVIVVIDLETAEEIASVLRFHQMSERGEIEDARS